MKFKDFEGSSEEISNFFQNNGLNISDYLNVNPEKKVERYWIFILVALFIILNIIVCFVEQNNKCYVPLTILSLASLGGLVGVVQHNYEKSTVSFIIGISGLLIMVISYKILSPKETIEKVKEKSEKYIDGQVEKSDEKK